LGGEHGLAKLVDVDDDFGSDHGDPVDLGDDLEVTLLLIVGVLVLAVTLRES